MGWPPLDMCPADKQESYTLLRDVGTRLERHSKAFWTNLVISPLDPCGHNLRHASQFARLDFSFTLLPILSSHLARERWLYRQSSSWMITRKPTRHPEPRSLPSLLHLWSLPWITKALSSTGGSFGLITVRMIINIVWHEHLRGTSVLDSLLQRG